LAAVPESTVSEPDHAPSLSYIVNHLGEERERYYGAVAPPVVQSSNFAFPTVAAFRAAFTDEFRTHLYSRGNNPTVEILRKKLAALEGAEEALVFGSGMAPIAIGALASVSAGDEALCVAKPYSWTRALVRDLLPRYGVATRFVDLTDPAALEAALTERTRLILLESPNTWTYEQQDLAAIAAIAGPRGITTLIDNSWASPLLQSPHAFGIDLVAHSATKYLGGHSDVVAGVLTGSEQQLRKIFAGPFMTIGPLLGPHDAALLLRSLRTLPLRMRQIEASTRWLIGQLEGHPAVRRVIAVGARDYPQRELAELQLKGHSGLLTLELDTDRLAAVEAFCDALQGFLMAVSWGGHESLIAPVAAFIDPARPRAEVGGLRMNWVRLSIGLEEPAELLADLERGFAAMRAADA
jgi:cystathionine beta-lyase/cystathionine gamma-synthase